MEGILALMIPITALMIPIVAILVSHQQKMAQLIHGSGSRSVHQDAEIAAMREEIRMLKETMTQQSLLLDSLNDRAIRSRDDLSDRLRSNA